MRLWPQDRRSQRRFRKPFQSEVVQRPRVSMRSIQEEKMNKLRWRLYQVGMCLVVVALMYGFFELIILFNQFNHNKW
jgi:hypothetical protein